MICDDPFYTGICPARTKDGQCVSKFPCSHKVEPPKPPTNADRIRSMTDEELANIIECPYGNPCFDEHLPCKGSCHDCLLIWLQQPAEEDGHD